MSAQAPWAQVWGVHCADHLSDSKLVHFDILMALKALRRPYSTTPDLRQQPIRVQESPLPAPLIWRKNHSDAPLLLLTGGHKAIDSY